MVLQETKQTVERAAKPNRVRFGFLALGVVLIAVAWIVRQRVLTARRQSARAATAAARAAQIARMEAEAKTLEAYVKAAPTDVSFRQQLMALYQQTGHL